VISGNNNRGIAIATTGATSNIVQGNFIGTDITGKVALGNQTNGIMILGVAGNTIGGTNANARNLISGNQQSGILIIQTGASNNVVEGNYIGVDVTGAKALSNSFNGVMLDGVTSNLVGGAAVGMGNVISGNGENGVYLTDIGCGTNVVQGNLIGTDFTGKVIVGNALVGIRIEAPGNTIGGTSALARNIISGNANSGIFLFGGSASNNLIEGNFIGTDVTGTSGLGNVFSGVTLSNAPVNTIGGTVPGAGNVISANQNSGIVFQGTGTALNLVQGNYIGTDVTGNNGLGNLAGGIYSYASPSNIIGGATVGAGNIISGNSADGISIGNPGCNGNIIQGNFIGTKADGISALGNQWHNVEFLDTSSGNLVGGATAAADNRIAFTQTPGYDGVRIRAGCSNNFISRNSFFSNGVSSVNGIAICVGAAGVTLNDPSNDHQNFPVLTQAIAGTQTWVQGTLSSFANAMFLIQFYSTPVENVAGYGEGRTYLGSEYVTTGGSGSVSFSATLAAVVPAGQFLTATATDTNGNTSEFCADLAVAAAPSLSISRSGGTNAAPLTLSISWPVNPTGFSVVQTTNLTPPVVWVALTNNVTASGGTNYVTLSPAGGALFYRLLMMP
jgi:titin